MNLKDLIYSHTLCEEYGSTAGAVLDKIGAELRNKYSMSIAKDYLKERGFDIDNLKIIKLDDTNPVFTKTGIKNHKDCEIGLLYLTSTWRKDEPKNRNFFIFDFRADCYVRVDNMVIEKKYPIGSFVKDYKKPYHEYRTVACFGVKTK